MADDNKIPQKPDEGIGGFLIAIALVAVIGGGSGLALGSAAVVKAHSSSAKPASAAQAGDVQGRDEKSVQATSNKAKKESGHAFAGQLLPLEPMLVNMAEPSKRWLRLEGAIIFEKPLTDEKAVVLAQISQDLVGFLRNTSLQQMETSSGLEFLLEDMSELARLRTHGNARRFVLKSLVIE